jgi:hypothetical protein
MSGQARAPVLLKQAEWLSAAGVFVLGLGAGAWFGDVLTNFALALLVGGSLLHGVAMFGKHRIEVAGRLKQPVWYRWLYWLCWLLLALVGTWLFVTRT